MYNKPVKFAKTGQYGCGPVDEGDVYTVEEFLHLCKVKAFTDYDGHGYPVKDKLADNSIYLYPSNTSIIPEDATHIVWYNR